MKRLPFPLLALCFLGSASAATLTLWTSAESGTELEWLKTQAATFEKSTGDKVVVVTVPFAQTQDKFIQSAPKGQGPDLIATEPHDRLGRYAASGVIEPLDQYVTARADFDKTALGAFTYRGKLFGLPLSAEAVALVYNKKLVAQAPLTWSALLKAAQANTGNGKFGLLFDIAEPYKSYGFVSAYGGYVFKNKSGTLDTGDIGLDNAGTARALGFLNDLRYKYGLVAEGVGQDVAKSAFVDGRLAMFYTGPWDMADVKKAGIDYGIVPFPTPPGATSKWSPFVGVRAVLVNSYSKNKSAAVALARQLTNAEAQLSHYKASGSIPVSISARARLSADPVVAGFGRAISVGTSMPNIPEMGAVWGPWAAATAQGVQKPNQPYLDLLKKAVTEISSNIK